MTTPTESQPTIYIVDPDARARQLLAQTTRAQGLCAETFASIQTLERTLNGDAAGCVVVDVTRAAADVLGWQAKRVRNGRCLPVIFLAAEADVATAVAAMKGGAVDFLTKPFDLETLFERIQRALALDAERRRRVSERTAIEARFARLSPRQRETLDLIVAGQSNKAMASKLLISVRAVEMRRAQIMRKLEVRTLAELLDLAITHRQLSPPAQPTDSCSQAPPGNRPL